MNDLYRQELRLWLNLYLPSVKLVKKVRVGAKVRRVYDAPQTPLERVLASSSAPSAGGRLKKLRASLDPFQLGKMIERKIEEIYEMANRRLSPKSDRIVSVRAETKMKTAPGEGGGKDARGKVPNQTPELGNRSAIPTFPPPRRRTPVTFNVSTDPPKVTFLNGLIRGCRMRTGSALTPVSEAPCSL